MNRTRKIMIYKKIVFNIILVFVCGSFALGQDFGSAKIITVPESADVYINGYQMGRTPYCPSGIIPGTYDVKLKLSGYDSLTTSMPVDKAKRSVLKITLKRSEDSLAADSVIAEAEALPPKGKFIRLKSQPLLKDQGNEEPGGDLDRFKGLKGKVMLGLLLGGDGKVEKAEIEKSSGMFCLDHEAVKRAYKMFFYPALDENEKPVRTWVYFPMSF
jgi:TonB family protein